MEVSAIILKKLNNGNYQDPNNIDIQYSREVVEKNMKTVNLPGTEFFYDEESNVCAKFDIPGI